MTKKSVVVTDLDNTLYDWFRLWWFQPFNAMLETLQTSTDMNRETLLEEIKRVHVKYNTSEFPYVTDEMDCLKNMDPSIRVSAREAFESKRREVLVFYPTVEETLLALKRKGCLLIGYTETQAFYTHERLRLLGLDLILDYVYSPPTVEFEVPEGVEKKEPLPLRYTKDKHTPKGEKKPNPDILQQIIRDVGATQDEVIYIGNSLMQDIQMALHAGVTDVYARYGDDYQQDPDYDLLRQVTHWPERDVTTEQETTPETVPPTHTISEFSEILSIFEFSSFADASKRKDIIDVWKTTVDVQKHFNELGMKVRQFALTVITAVFAGAAISMREGTTVLVGGTSLPLAVFILFGGIPAWAGFWFMDRFWYHRLLLGSVQHGELIENRMRKTLPEIALAGSIRRASGVKVVYGLGWLLGPTLRSERKVSVFYGIGLLLIFGALLFSIVIPVTEKAEDTEKTKASKIEIQTQPQKIEIILRQPSGENAHNNTHTKTGADDMKLNRPAVAEKD